MARLIDAEKLEHDLDKYYKPEHDGVKHWIQVQPTVDAVPVVRCRDCKYSDLSGYYVYCEAWWMPHGMGLDGFCGYGEKEQAPE